jgi:hypothetical protein
MLMHQLAARLGDEPFSAKQKRYAATVTDAEADQMRRRHCHI